MLYSILRLCGLSLSHYTSIFGALCVDVYSKINLSALQIHPQFYQTNCGRLSECTAHDIAFCLLKILYLLSISLPSGVLIEIEVSKVYSIFQKECKVVNIIKIPYQLISIFCIKKCSVRLTLELLSIFTWSVTPIYAYN